MPRLTIKRAGWALAAAIVALWFYAGFTIAEHGGSFDSFEARR